VKQCVTHHSQLYSDAQKACLHSSHLSQLYRVCALGKQVALPNQNTPTLPEGHAERPGKIISADLLTVEVPSIGGARYVLAVTDMSTRYHWTVPLRLKSDATDKLHHIILSMPETHRPLNLRTDGSGKFFNACLGLWLNEQGILHPPAPPYTSEYNGLSECFLRTLMAHVRCCLIDAGLPDKYWAEACAHAIYLVNVTPTKVNTDYASPYELWHRHSPPLHTLCVFGCPGTMVAPGKHKKKLQLQIVDVCFLSHHPTSSSIFCILVNTTGCVTHSRNVVFNETLPVLHAQPMSSCKLFDPSQFSRADPWPPQIFDPITSSNDRGESSKVSLDDVPAPETMPAPVHKPTPTISACTSMSSSISSPTHAPTSKLSSAVQAPPSLTREQ